MQYVLPYEHWKLNESRIDEGLLDGIVDSWSGALHLAADLGAGFADFVVPGSGLAIDVANSLAYFIESYLAEDRWDKVLSSIYGIIQLFAAIDPLNLISKLNLLVKKVFGIITGKIKTITGDFLAEIGFLQKGLVRIKDAINSLYNKIINTNAFKDSVDWISKKLGQSDGFAWFKKFFTQTLPTHITEFLELLKKVNPKKIGARVVGEESEETLFKVGGKTTASYVAHSKVIDAYLERIKNMQYELNNRNKLVPAQDNTRVEPYFIRNRR